jgi:hypothetical protein
MEAEVSNLKEPFLNLPGGAEENHDTPVRIVNRSSTLTVGELLSDS